MTNKLKTHFKHFVIGSLIAALGAGTYVIAAVTFSDFTTGTPISSTAMNTKLNALKTAVNATPVTVVTSASIGAGTFGSAVAICPANHYAIGGGVDLENVLTMVVTQSTPRIGGTRIQLIADGQYGAPDSWQGAAVNNSAGTLSIKVGVICAPVP